MKPTSEMNPTELLRYQVELLEKLVNDRQVTVKNFDVSFVKLFGIFLKAIPAAICAYVFALIIVALFSQVAISLLGR